MTDAAQAEIVNPAPPQLQITHEVAWHSTLNPAAVAQDIASDDDANSGDEAVDDALVEHAAGEHTALAEGTSPPAPTPATEAATTPSPVGTGIMAMLPSITFHGRPRPA